MVKADYEAVKNDNYVSNREFVCGLVEVTGNRGRQQGRSYLFIY